MTQSTSGRNPVVAEVLVGLLTFVLSILAVVGYIVALARGRSVWRAVLLAQMPCSLIATAATALVSST